MIVTIPCVCPPLSTGAARHTEDQITLRETLSFRAGRTIRYSIIVERTNNPEGSVAEILAMLTEVYLLEGIETWTLVDQRNKPIAVDRATIRAFMEEHGAEASMVGDVADGIYVEAVMHDLKAIASTSSPPMPIDASTSVTTGSSPKRPRRSKPSSITTSQTDGTMTMYASPGGASNS